MLCCLGWGQKGPSQPAAGQRAGRASSMARDARCLWANSYCGAVALAAEAAASGPH